MTPPINTTQTLYSACTVVFHFLDTATKDPQFAEVFPARPPEMDAIKDALTHADVDGLQPAEPGLLAAAVVAWQLLHEKGGQLQRAAWNAMYTEALWLDEEVPLPPQEGEEEWESWQGEPPARPQLPRWTLLPPPPEPEEYDASLLNVADPRKRVQAERERIRNRPPSEMHNLDPGGYERYVLENAIYKATGRLPEPR